MLLKKALSDLTKVVKVVSDEAERNPEFAKRLEESLNRDHKRKRRNRRAPAVLDPVALAAEGEDGLRSQLARLNLDQLKDIVAEYGMDPKKLVMRWKRPERVINVIVESSLGRARKGDAFRS